MDAETKKIDVVGRHVRLIVRQPNGQISVYTGTILSDDATTWQIKTDRGELRMEPKLYAAIEVV